MRLKRMMTCFFGLFLLLAVAPGVAVGEDVEVTHPVTIPKIKWGTILKAMEAAKTTKAHDIIERMGDVGHYGYLGPWEYCPPGSYAAGYSMKVEGRELRAFGEGDNTATNGIKLFCYNKNTGKWVKDITSNEGEYGVYWNRVNCPNSYDKNVPINNFLKNVRFKQEHPQGDDDDTGTNSVKFQCSKGQEIQASRTMPWGYWGPLLKCPPGTVICGIQTRVEPPLGDGDDTGLNGANFACCKP